MKKLFSITVALFTALMLQFSLPAASLAAFVSGSTGASGAFSPTTSTTVQIPDSGVFNYTTVNIPSGVTITYSKNAANTPVTILATGDVTISGTININGSNGNKLAYSAGGPGGFNGGVGGTISQIGSRGEGQGAGNGGSPPSGSNTAGAGNGGGGGYGTNGYGGGTYSSWNYYGSPGSGGNAYGNDRALPLIGGSGGGGGGGTTAYVGGGGGGGGGSILIASSGTITVNGSIAANGGYAANGDGVYSTYYGNPAEFYGGGGGGGSGGSVRLVANTLAGAGTISAVGGGGGRGTYASGGSGGAGRIRLEATNYSQLTVTTNPYPPSVNIPSAVIPAGMPTLTITSIAGKPVTGPTTGSSYTPDIILDPGTTSPVTVVVTATNIPVGTNVTVKASPKIGSVTTASPVALGSDLTGSASLPISTTSPSVITASVTYQLTASNGGPIYADGERVDRIRVAANLGGGSSITYITESGREIAATM